MKKSKIYSYSHFFDNKNEAVKAFLHHSIDHKNAAYQLSNHLNFLDSSAYLYHLAFELLLKSIYLYENEEIENIHNLISLSKGQHTYSLDEKSENLLVIIDEFYFARYPIDKKLLSTKKELIFNEETFLPGEVSTSILKGAHLLFINILNKLYHISTFHGLLNEIHESPFKKGNTIMMRKKIGHDE